MPTLVVQMGHAGRTSGVTGAPGEQAFTQRVGEACHRILAGRGWDIRTIIADPAAAEYRGSAFFAVHADGNNNPNVVGSSLGYQTSQGQNVARAWREAYVTLGWAGPWHPDNYTDNLHYYYGVGDAIKQGNSAACIIECGTITNPGEKAAMESQEGVDRVAKAIGSAVGIYHAEDDLSCQFNPDNDRAIWSANARVSTVMEMLDNSAAHGDPNPIHNAIGQYLQDMNVKIDTTVAKLDELLSRSPAGPTASEVASALIIQLGGRA